MNEDLLLRSHAWTFQGSKTTDGTIARASAMFFDGDKAAVAAKWAQPQDLHTLSLKNDLGSSSILASDLQLERDQRNLIVQWFGLEIGWMSRL